MSWVKLHGVVLGFFFEYFLFKCIDPWWKAFEGADEWEFGECFTVFYVDCEASFEILINDSKEMATFTIPIREEDDMGVLWGYLITEVGDGHAFVEGYNDTSDAKFVEGFFVMGAFDDDGCILVVEY